METEQRYHPPHPILGLVETFEALNSWIADKRRRSQEVKTQGAELFKEASRLLQDQRCSSVRRNRITSITAPIVVDLNSQITEVYLSQRVESLNNPKSQRNIVVKENLYTHGKVKTRDLFQISADGKIRRKSGKGNPIENFAQISQIISAIKE